MYKVYVLALEEEKYYVGITKDLSTLKRDYQKHLNEEFPWTKMYRPLYICRVIDHCTVFDEDMWTKIYMLKHGMENVRGGTYNYIHLYSNVETFLQIELSSLQRRSLKNRTLEPFLNQQNVSKLE